MFSQIEQQAALKLARTSIARVFDKNISLDEDYKNHQVFEEQRGVFVTLKKDGELHGCVGLIEPPKISLAQAIQEMAVSTAFHDARFSPLTVDELNKIKIEISVLTVPKKIKSVAEIELGKHGVIVKSGWQNGVFLPQVALETGWSKEKFLNELCHQKAGLPENCWQDPRVELYTFEAEVYSELRR